MIRADRMAELAEAGNAAIDRLRNAPPTEGRGESGELGENPRGSRDAAGRISGEAGRILGEIEVHRAMTAAEGRLSAPAAARQSYPVHALGPLADACHAIAEGGQIAPEIAGQCLLAAASLLVQSHVNAMTAEGPKPASINLLTIATSGDGKSTAEKATLRPIEEHQRERVTWYAHELDTFEQSAGQRRKDEPLPQRPREPYLLVRDGTVEGIRRGFKEGMPSQAVFTSEAAAILSGYGMSQEQRAKTAANFNSLWDGGEISVSRGTTGRLQLYDRRLAVHWQIQPEAVREALHSPLLSAIGFWPRFLLAWPEPGKPRAWRPFDPAQYPAIVKYWRRCSELLARPQGEDCGGLPTLPVEPAALELAGQFFERVEAGAKLAGGELEAVRPFASRATEQVFRVATILAKFADLPTIGTQTMRDAIRLAAYNLETWSAIFGDRAECEAREWALTLYRWMLHQPHQTASETAILRVGPKALRSRYRRDTALAVLAQAGLVRQHRENWRAGAHE